MQSVHSSIESSNVHVKSANNESCQILDKVNMNVFLDAKTLG